MHADGKNPTVFQVTLLFARRRTNAEEMMVDVLHAIALPTP